MPSPPTSASRIPRISYPIYVIIHMLAFPIYLIYVYTIVLWVLILFHILLNHAWVCDNITMLFWDVVGLRGNLPGNIYTCIHTYVANNSTSYHVCTCTCMCCVRMYNPRFVFVCLCCCIHHIMEELHDFLR